MKENNVKTMKENNGKTMKENNGKTKRKTRKTRKTRKENTSKPIRFKQEGGSGGFVGLEIKGYNNCYLAAAIQLLWSIEDFRTNLLKISREDIIKLEARNLTQPFLEAEFTESIKSFNEVNAAAASDSEKFVYIAAVAANIDDEKNSDINNIIALQELYRKYQDTVTEAKKTLVINDSIKFNNFSNEETTFIKQFDSLINRTDSTQEDASDVLKLLRPFIDYSTNDDKSVNSLFKFFATTTLRIQDIMEERMERANLLKIELLELENKAASAATNADQNLSAQLTKQIADKTEELEQAQQDIQRPSKSYSIEINPYLLLTTPSETVIASIKEGIDNIQDSATVVKVYNENKYVLLYVNRRNDTDDTVNRANIVIDTVVTIDKNKYKIYGCICHTGTKASNGHYIYFAYNDNGIISKVISDSTIYDDKYDVNTTITPKTHGTIFLYKKILSAEAVRVDELGKTAQPVQVDELGKTALPVSLDKTGSLGKTVSLGNTVSQGKRVQTVPTAQPDKRKFPEAHGVILKDKEQEEQSSETIYSNSGNTGKNIILGSLLCITIIVSTLMLT